MQTPKTWIQFQFVPWFVLFCIVKGKATWMPCWDVTAPQLSLCIPPSGVSGMGQTMKPAEVSVHVSWSAISARAVTFGKGVQLTAEGDTRVCRPAVSCVLWVARAQASSPKEAGMEFRDVQYMLLWQQPSWTTVSVTESLESPTYPVPLAGWDLLKLSSSEAIH